MDSTHICFLPNMVVHIMFPIHEQFWILKVSRHAPLQDLYSKTKRKFGPKCPSIEFDDAHHKSPSLQSTSNMIPSTNIIEQGTQWSISKIRFPHFPIDSNEHEMYEYRTMTAKKSITLSHLSFLMSVFLHPLKLYICYRYCMRQSKELTNASGALVSDHSGTLLHLSNKFYLPICVPPLGTAFIDQSDLWLPFFRISLTSC